MREIKPKSLGRDVAAAGVRVHSATVGRVVPTRCVGPNRMCGVEGVLEAVEACEDGALARSPVLAAAGLVDLRRAAELAIHRDDRFVHSCRRQGGEKSLSACPVCRGRGPWPGVRRDSPENAARR